MDNGRLTDNQFKIMKLKAEIFDLQIELARIKLMVEDKLKLLNAANREDAPVETRRVPSG